MTPRFISFLKFLAFSFSFFMMSIGLWLFLANGVPLTMILRFSTIMGLAIGGLVWGLFVPPITVVYDMNRPPPYYYWSLLNHYEKFRAQYIWLAITIFLFFMTNMAPTFNSFIVAGTTSIVPTFVILAIGGLRKEMFASLDC